MNLSKVQPHSSGCGQQLYAKMNDPKDSIDAVLAAPKEVAGLEVQHLTLGRYALLELVNSPFVDSTQKFNAATLIPTFYIMTQSFKELVGYDSSNINKLIEKAFVWADTQEIANASALINAITEKFGLINRVAPPNTDEKK